MASAASDGPSGVTSFELDGREEMLWAMGFAMAFTVLRWIGNRLVLGRPTIRQDKNLLTPLDRIFEEIWLMVLSFGLLAFSWGVFLDNDVGASMTNTHALVKGWPENRVKTEVPWLLRVETGWYVHQVTRGWSASGVPLDGVMFYHHIGTLAIILFGYWKNLLLLGVMTVAIFNISNPFLHLSKIAYVLDMRRTRVVFFALFGLAFFVSRVVMLPMTIMKMGYIDAYKEDVESFGPRLLLLGNIMIAVLYGLQIFWMVKIVRVLRRGQTGSTPTKQQEKQTPFSDARPVPNGKPKDN